MENIKLRRWNSKDANEKVMVGEEKSKEIKGEHFQDTTKLTKVYIRKREKRYRKIYAWNTKG